MHFDKVKRVCVGIMQILVGLLSLTLGLVFMLSHNSDRLFGLLDGIGDSCGYSEWDHLTFGTINFYLTL